MRGRSPGVLLAPRGRPGRAADFATRARVMAHQRHAARRIRRARRSLRTAGRALALGLALLALAGGGVVAHRWLRTTSLLWVTTVEIVGTHRLGEGTVRGAAGIESGTSLLALDVQAIQSRVEALPGVRHARVVRHWPPRVTILVEEREPYALVNVSGGGSAQDRLVWVDAEGYLVGPEERPGIPPLPILSGVERSAANRPPADGLRTGLALLRALERSGGRVPTRVSEIDLGAAEAPVLYLTDGTEVRIGTEPWDERLARLDGVLADLDSRDEQVLSVDLRFRDQVVLKPRPERPPRDGSGTASRRRAAGSAANSTHSPERH